MIIVRRPELPELVTSKNKKNDTLKLSPRALARRRRWTALSTRDSPLLIAEAIKERPISSQVDGSVIMCR